jgi:hypothetical protein
MKVLTSKLRVILKIESDNKVDDGSTNSETTSENKISSSSSSSLASVLVKECTDHVFKTTKIGDSEDCKVYESLHPYWARGLGRDSYRSRGGVDYSEEVSFPGAKALRVRFDPRCSSEQNHKTHLIFTKDDDQTKIAAINGPPSEWKSFVIHSDRFKFRFRAHTDSKNPGWGYKFTVSPLLGLSWSSESQVLSEPSLEYACWILDFLLSKTVDGKDSDESSMKVRRAVCTADVFLALANYLRSPGAPYKKRVVYLITQLLKSPELFPIGDEPDLKQLKGVKKHVMRKCLDVSTDTTGIVLPEGLQQLVEMILVSREAKEFFKRRKGKNENKKTKSTQYVNSLNTMQVLSTNNSQALNYALEKTAGYAQKVRDRKDAQRDRRLRQSREQRHHNYGLDPFMGLRHAYGGEGRILHSDSSRARVSSTTSKKEDTANAEIEEMEKALLETIEVVDCLAKCGKTALPLFMVTRALHVCRPSPDLITDGIKEKIKSLKRNLESAKAELSEARANEDSFDEGEIQMLHDTERRLQAQLKEERKHKQNIEKKKREERERQRQNKKTIKKEDNWKMKPAIQNDIGDFKKWCDGLSKWTIEQDRELTTFLNDKQEELVSAQRERGGRSRINEILLNISELELPTERTAKIETRYSKILDKSVEDVRMRAAVVQVFNDQLERVIPFIDLNVRDNSQRVGARLKVIRHLVLMSVKMKLMDAALRATSSRGHHRSVQVVINRYKAQQSKEQGFISPDTSKSSFVQTFKQMYGKISWASLRGSEKVFRVSYAGGLGEQGVDAGGPYRETLTEVCTDLFNTDVLDLFIKSPNAVDERGQTRDRYVPNPVYTSPQSIQMYEFVGVWIGLSFRTKSNLPFQLSSMLWKTLVGETLNIDDIEEIDDEIVEKINSMRGKEKKKNDNGDDGDNSDDSDDGEGETKVNKDEDHRRRFESRWSQQPFQAKRCDGSVVDLIPGGADIKVTYERRME